MTMLKTAVRLAAIAVVVLQGCSAFTTIGSRYNAGAKFYKQVGSPRLERKLVLYSDNTVGDVYIQDSRPNHLDATLSRLTSLFPFYVVLATALGAFKPNLLQWVDQGNRITYMLACVMCGTGLTLQASDFTRVYRQQRFAVPLGVACQFIIMPASAWFVGRQLLALAGPASSIGPPLFLGLCLVGCSPGGTASNLVALIANADVALSVILTACSTIMAVFMTPLLVKYLVSSSATATTTAITISGWALCAATAKVIFGPVMLGMGINAKFQKAARTIGRFTPLASSILVALICGGVIAQNSSLLSAVTTIDNNQLNPLSMSLFAVVILHTIGFAAGYIIPKNIFGQSERTSRTISIEVGMQNSALAVVLAQSITQASALACLPGALSATVHSCLGSVLAAIWRQERQSVVNDKGGSSSSSNSNNKDQPKA